MSRLRVQGLGYRYPDADAPALAGIDLVVAPGEVVLVCGPTGGGKSTLVRLVAGLTQRHGQGQVLGRVEVDGEDPGALAPSRRVRALGLVGQEPADQLVTGRVGDELAFAMESAGWAPEAMQAALPGLLEAVGLDLPLDRDPRRLSGGQVQRLVTGAALAAGAGLLVLDEPLAQLDPQGARALLARLRALARGGVAVLLVEHRVATCLPFVDRVLVLAGGTLRADLDRTAFERGVGQGQLEAFGLLRPPVPPPHAGEAPAPGPGPVRVDLQELSFTWPGAPAPSLQAISVACGAGERVAVLGANGAGKSTLLGLVHGRLRAPGVRVRAPAVAVPQDADLSLFAATVREELAYGPRERGLPDLAGRVEELLRRFDLLPLADRPPQALSRGQRLRVAVAAALACAPPVLLLDEPTSGQDADQVARTMAGLRGGAPDLLLVFATHDLDLVRGHATRVLVLDAGRLVFDGPPEAMGPHLPPALRDAEPAPGAA